MSPDPVSGGTDHWAPYGGDGVEASSDPVWPIARRFLVTLVVFCLFGAVVNVAMPVRAPEWERGVRGHDDGGLSRLVAEEQEGLRKRYLFNAVLHDTIAGGTLVVPDESLVGRFEVENLAQVVVEVAQYDPEIDAAAADRFRALGVQGNGAIRRDGRPQTFVVVAEPAPADSRYRLLFHRDIAFVVPDEVAAVVAS